MARNPRIEAQEAFIFDARSLKVLRPMKIGVDELPSGTIVDSKIFRTWDKGVVLRLVENGYAVPSAEKPSYVPTPVPPTASTEPNPRQAREFRVVVTPGDQRAAYRGAGSMSAQLRSYRP